MFPEKNNIYEKIINKNLSDFNITDEQKQIVKENLIKKFEDNKNENGINEEDKALYLAINICIEKEIDYIKKLEQYKDFKKNYNKKILSSITFGIIIPLLFTGFLINLKYKLIMLLYIIFSIIISSFYIIILEYINHSLKTELKIRD